MSTTTATILHLQRLSTEDGPGLRTTIFFKGCPLHCSWCHNPESLSPRPQIHWLESRCIDCGTCLPACPQGNLIKTAEGVVINRERCDGCGACAEACPAGAMELLGARRDLDELVALILKDRAYFEASGGGVTASGGEPTGQARFVAALFQRLTAAGVQTALDTCGFCSPAALEEILPYTDTVLYDLKEIDGERHGRFTGQDNSRILQNLLLVRDHLLGDSSRRGGVRPMMANPAFGGSETRWERNIMVSAAGRSVAAGARPALWIRTPLIPGATATPENVAGIGRFIADHLDGAVARWELCAFNNLCRDKYRRLGMKWEHAETPLLTADQVEALTACARESGVDPAIVAPTGVTTPPLR